MINIHNKEMHKLENLIAYEFENKKLLLTALTHSSYSNEKKAKQLENNERLEFLGDAILKLSISDYLYRNYPEYAEGIMTKIRALLISDHTLAKIAKSVDLGRMLLLSKNEKKTGGETRPSILANALEAIIGAIYLDGGLEKAKKIIYALFQVQLETIGPAFSTHDYKSKLQEYMQQNNLGLPEYTTIKELGPDHNKTFIIEGRVLLNNNEIKAIGRGKTKKISEQNVARRVLKKLGVL
ncbi:MAG: ribonuclease III [Candidatus Margulisbacteria bacterium GWF2_38_17]|nr:MAG: ribonuclease III [Candidatus Margulisbacteria bacterium GWD2_39_127]OGI03925.1 MAG: ribonuclease III [Candidatus Margulisbacteria bacterium GWF2_38_17]OGI08195.1 MAG: ribonuclease III [Candidatus Margulisbacteria bacterium GWE2_39_32]